MSIMTFKTDEEAIKLANGSGYGLACSIYSTDTARAYKVAQNVEAGLVRGLDRLSVLKLISRAFPYRSI
jgi:acyl-CoA reductase-like NAD-dependent aldehyde dehydrogenase